MISIKDVPKRFVVILLCFFGLFNLFSLRFNFSVAIVAMVKEVAAPIQEIEETCSDLANVSLHYINNNISDFDNVSSNLQGEFEWDSELRGQIQASFYYGYILPQIPGGILSERYGAKWIYGIGLLTTTIFSMLTPILARWSVWALIASRVIQGLGQGVVMPASNALVGRWAAKMERSRVSTFIFIGCSAGNAVALAASGALCDSNFLGGWPSVFYVFGSIGCIWLFFWTWLVYESPETHPRISKEELQHILRNQDRDQKKLPIPWYNLLTSVPVWALSITHMCQAWGSYTLLIELPNYLSNILQFDLRSNGIMSALPQLTNVLGSILASIVADKMRENGCLKITAIRKIFNSIGFFGGAACMLLVAFVGCSPTLIVGLLTLSVGLMGANHSGFFVTHGDMSPELAGKYIHF